MRLGGLRRALDGAGFAVVFLTVVPLRLREDHAGGDAAPAWFGLVGALVGAVGAGVFAAAEPLLGSAVAAILATAALVLVTGGLHQDGLADCADGLGVRGDRERRLAVMRDPSIGTFGALALGLWGLLLTTSLAQLESGEAVAALPAVAAVGRWAALLHARWAPPARAEGLGSTFAPSTAAVLVAGLTAILVGAVANVATAGALAVAALVVAAGVSVWSRRALGGRTGDTLGATVVLAELAAVLVALAFARD